MKKNGKDGSIPRTMSRKTNPSISPSMMSEMMALKARGCVFSTWTASSTEATDTGVYPSRFKRAQRIRRMIFSSSTTRIIVFPGKSALFANGSPPFCIFCSLSFLLALLAIYAGKKYITFKPFP